MRKLTLEAQIKHYGKKVNRMKKENTKKLNRRRRFIAFFLTAVSLFIGGENADRIFSLYREL